MRFLFKKGLFQNILSCPERLAAVNYHLGLSTMGHEVDGRSKDEAVGSYEFLVENLHTVIDDTFALLETTAAFETGRYS